ncbi:prephenate dehydrogenase/arogenate dehydrogenase family protein [Gammaproteobacteria bacterium]|nr:prephenate dehydrogenase/arogenate dehydrogenase family protein [Gammaproteobacteria bacterium]
MKIIIIGLGLIGGSIAKQLMAKNEMTILAYDSNQNSIQNALNKSNIHGAIAHLDELQLPEHENSLIVIATPPKASLEILRSLSPLFNSSTTITDTSSIKLPAEIILDEFNNPDNIILSHPVAGSHNSGEQYSQDNLFFDKNVIVSALPSANKEHLQKVKLLWESLQSRVIDLDSKTHDYIFAHSSHLPHFASYALLMTLMDLKEENIAQFSGGGFGEFLRLTSSSPEMWADIFALNKDNINTSIDSFIGNLHHLKSTINKEPASLQALLADLKNFKEENY